MSNNSVAAFSQQGQLDYVAAGTSVVSGASLILQRFADAGIQPMTHQAGFAISMQFQLGELGSQRVRDALSRIRPSHGFESVLWFGFGYKSYLALLTEQELGLNCAALCACLGETYGEARAAQLLQALWRTYNFSNELEPSRSQYRALISNCSGFLLSTPFPDIVQRMAGPYKDDGYVNASLSATTSTDLAKALNALFQISKGALKAIEVHGGRDIAFLAAVAYWLFDLKVWVQMHDGSTMFSNCLYREQASVRLHWGDVDSTQSSLIQVSATTFVLRSVEDLIIDDPHSPIIFRINWDCCLTELFHDEVEDILDQAALLGKVLGAVARIYQAIATCEMDVGGFSRTHFVNFQPRGYGRSFIEGICTLLPEIGSEAAFLEGAKDSLSQSVAENKTAVPVLIGQLKADCLCGTCTSKSALISRHHSCNVAVVLFLRHIGDLMAHVDFDLPIDPTRSALETAYDDQRTTWSRAQNAGESSILGIVMDIPHARDGMAEFSVSYPREPQFLLNHVLDGISRLFIGRGSHSEFALERREGAQQGAQCTALSRAGVCIWLDALRSANTDPGSMSTVHVVPGQVVCKNRSYASVWDLSSASEASLVKMPLVEFSRSGTSEALPMQTSGMNPQLQALAEERETEGTIRFAYKVNSSYPTRYLQPGILTEELLVSSARAPCRKATTCSDHLSVPYYQRRSGWDLLNSENGDISFHDGGAFLLWKAPDPISKLLAIEGCRKDIWYRDGKARGLSLILIRSEQCMACLARYWHDSKRVLLQEYSMYIEVKLEEECITDRVKSQQLMMKLPCFVNII